MIEIIVDEAYWDPEGHQAYKLAVFNIGQIINRWATRCSGVKVIRKSIIRQFHLFREQQYE